MSLKILLVSYNFKNNKSPRSLKWQKLEKEWSKTLSVDVICEDTTTHIQKDLKENSPSIFKKILIKFRWPDYAMLWCIKELVRSFRSDFSSYDRLITSSHPFSSHLIGLLIKKRNKSLSWTMDVGDPFSIGSELHLNAPWFSKLNNYFERKCLQHCDRITLNTVSLKDLYINYYGINEKKIYVVPPVTDFQLNRLKKPTNKRFIYAGRFYSKQRPLNVLLKIFLEIQKLYPDASLDIYGPKLIEYKSLIKEYGLTEKVFLKGFVSQNRLRKSIIDYDYYLNIGNKSSHQQPSKNLDLLSFGLPVINIIQNQNDPFIKISQKIFFIRNIQKHDTANLLSSAFNELQNLFNSHDKISAVELKAKRIINQSLPNKQQIYYE